MSDRALDFTPHRFDGARCSGFSTETLNAVTGAFASVAAIGQRMMIEPRQRRWDVEHADDCIVHRTVDGVPACFCKLSASVCRAALAARLPAGEDALQGIERLKSRESNSSRSRSRPAGRALETHHVHLPGEHFLDAAHGANPVADL